MDRPPSPQRLPVLVIGGLAISLLFYLRCAPWDLHSHVLIGAPFGRDFVNFWIGGRLALSGQTALFHDLGTYNALIETTFDHAPDSFIFSYPPHLLLVLAPLATMPYGAALALWTTGNLAALATATRLLATNSAERGRLALWACMSPAVLMMVLYGHFGGLMALALVVVLLGGETRPVLAGMCLAALTVKPQIALAVGIVLLGAGRVRCLAVATAITGVLVALSAVVFGVEIWRIFIEFTLPEQSRILAGGAVEMLGTTISVFRALQGLGAPLWLAWTAQVGVTLAALIAAIAVVRRGEDRATIAFVVPLAALLALPYANHYDLAMVAPALAVLLFSDRAASRFSAFGAATWLLPPLTYSLTHLGLPILPIVLAGAFVRKSLPEAPRRMAFFAYPSAISMREKA